MQRGKSHTQSTAVKKKRRNTLVTAKRLLGTPEGHFVIYGFDASLGSNSEFLDNGYPIHFFNTFPYYRSTFKSRTLLS